MSQLSAFLEAHPGWEPIESESEDDDDDDDDESEDKSDGRFINFGFVHKFFHRLNLRNTNQARIKPVIPKKRSQRNPCTKRRWKMMNIKQKNRHIIVLLILFMK